MSDHVEISPVKLRADYTEGSIIGSILKMGVPSMFGFLSQNIYLLVDTFWVSKLPGAESGVAALTFFNSLMWLFFSFNDLVGPGSVAIISRRYGEKDFDRAETAIKEAVLLKLFFGCLLGIIGWLNIGWMLRAVGAEGEALQNGIVYGRVMFLGLGAFYAMYTIFTAMRGIANPQMAMILMLASNGLNMVLDPIVMFGYCGLPALGIRGAAVASVISAALTVAVGLVLLYGDFTNVRLHLRSRYAMHIASMWKMVRIGVPAWLGGLSFSSARLVITPLMAAFGTEVVAAYGVGNQVTHFGIQILVGIGLGLSSLIGHNVGSGKIERARMTGDRAIFLGVAIMSVFALVVLALPRQIMGAFFDSPQTVSYGVTMLRIFAVGFPFMGAYMIIFEIHSGVGLNTPAMVMNTVQAWALEVGPVFLLTAVLGFNQNVIWWTITLAMMVSTAAFYLYYRRGRWLTVQV